MYPPQSFARRALGLTPLCASGLTILTANAAAPVAYDDVIAGKADTQLVLDYLLLNDTDADGNPLSITAVGTHSDLLRESEHYRHVISSLEVEEARLREREVNL